MVYVSRFEEALDVALVELPEKHTDMINNITDTICGAIQERVRECTVDYLADSIKEDISERAAKVAESMLMNALAGDDQTIRNLFDFNSYYMKNLYLGSLPTQWALIDAIAERNPKLFSDERIKQQAAQIVELRNSCDYLEKECAALKKSRDA